MYNEEKDTTFNDTYFATDLNTVVEKLGTTNLIHLKWKGQRVRGLVEIRLKHQRKSCQVFQSACML